MPIYLGNTEYKPEGIANAYVGTTQVYAAVTLPELDLSGYNITRAYCPFKTTLYNDINDYGYAKIRPFGGADISIPFGGNNRPDFALIAGSTKYYYSEVLCQITGHSIDAYDELAVEADQPCLAVHDTTGVYMKDTLPALRFPRKSGVDGVAISELDAANNWGLSFVVSSDISADGQAFFSSALTSADRIAMYCDSRINANIALIRDAAANKLFNYLAQQNTLDLRHIVITKTGSTVDTYFDGVLQESLVIDESYVNDIFKIGAQHGNITQLDGYLSSTLVANAAWNATDAANLFAALQTIYPTL